MRCRSGAILLSLVATASLTLSAQTSPLRLVSTAWPPFTNPTGQPRFALDLVEAALGRVGLTAKTTIVSAAQFTPSLLSGKFDGSAAAWKDPERERALIFSQPYLENRLVLVGRYGADVSAKALPDLAGPEEADLRAERRQRPRAVELGGDELTGGNVRDREPKTSSRRNASQSVNGVQSATVHSLPRRSSRSPCCQPDADSFERGVRSRPARRAIWMPAAGTVKTR